MAVDRVVEVVVLVHVEPLSDQPGRHRYSVVVTAAAVRMQSVPDRRPTGHE